MVKIIAIGPFCYGSSTSKDQAIANAKKHWPSGLYAPTDPVTGKKILRPKPEHFTLYETEAEEYTVWDNGSVSVKPPHTLKKIQTSTLATN